MCDLSCTPDKRRWCCRRTGTGAPVGIPASLLVICIPRTERVRDCNRDRDDQTAPLIPSALLSLIGPGGQADRLGFRSPLLGAKSLSARWRIGSALQSHAALR